MDAYGDLYRAILMSNERNIDLRHWIGGSLYAVTVAIGAFAVLACSYLLLWSIDVPRQSVLGVFIHAFIDLVFAACVGWLIVLLGWKAAARAAVKEGFSFDPEFIRRVRGSLFRIFIPIAALFGFCRGLLAEVEDINEYVYWMLEVLLALTFAVLLMVLHIWRKRLRGDAHRQWR